ncbi:unnamed protein product [Adineta ricciae]|uniref:Uncharacterized protein n=1 Tax=Adineta ricciae TaxID=249248 RepID=A0A816BDJ6_ADIRI|nr:unnamed protein product [Adineta ricciae]
MTENNSKSLNNILSTLTNNLSQAPSPTDFETRRDELHHELAMHWPFQTDASNSSDVAPTISKSTAQSSICDGATPNEKDSIHQTVSYSPSANLPSTNLAGLSSKKIEMKTSVKPSTSEESMSEHDQHIGWNLKAQQGVITYQLPDNLPDSVALHNKLQKLMKTNTIYLNDRKFWTVLENRFKLLRKQNFQGNMQRLRQFQQNYEQELVSKGVIPSTTEQVIRQYAEQQHVQVTTNNIDTQTLQRKPIEELEPFESDNVHPRFHEIFIDYQFQSKSGKEQGEKFENNLHKSQLRVKTIFPKLNQRDLIRQELNAIKTSEGLYSYSSRLAKQL